MAPEEVFKIGSKEVFKVKRFSNSGKKDNIPWSDLPEVLKADQAMRKSRIGKPTFLKLAQEGALPETVKVGDSWLIDRDKLRAYFQVQEDPE